jgi:hypothetical protein
MYLRYRCLTLRCAPFHGGLEGLLYYFLWWLSFSSLNGTTRNVTIDRLQLKIVLVIEHCVRPVSVQAVSKRIKKSSEVKFTPFSCKNRINH